MTITATLLLVAGAAGCSRGGPGSGGSGGPVIVAPTTPSTVAAASGGTGQAASGGTGQAASALPQLRDYLQQADVMDAALQRVATRVNADVTKAGVRPRPETLTAIEGVRDVQALQRAFPPGMSTALTKASLLVFSNLASRAAAFHGVPYHAATSTTGEYRIMMACLANGSRAAARFGSDVAALKKLAASSPAFTPALPASRAVAEIALQTLWVWKDEACCDSCGGRVSDRLAPIVWGHSTGISGPADGTIDGVDFAASYHTGTGWKVEIHAG